MLLCQQAFDLTTCTYVAAGSVAGKAASLKRAVGALDLPNYKATTITLFNRLTEDEKVVAKVVLLKGYEIELLVGTALPRQCLS